ncbi:MAG: SpoIIE family protein phosphatase [Bacteroidetes bacterium]|nr:SpoIIE family protein phosphatase [Bacteroidota bacterium]
MLYKQLGKASQALEYSMECSSLKDTLYNKDQTSITAEMQTRFATEKKQQENEILNLQVKSESFIKTIFIIAAGLLLVIAFFIFRGLRQKQKANIALEEKNKIIEEQKQTVEHQKHIAEEQNKDITDSIRYAERIQNAILPPEKQWNSIFPQSFVFYKPKDILSGDFYWIEQKGDLVFVAAADCTGHGVPGALISIVNYNLLNKAVLEKDLNNPADILNYVNHQLTLALHQTFQESSVKDGMDISLCVLNTKTLELNYSGANNPIYIIHQIENAVTRISEVKADKFPVGAFVDEQVQSFTSKQIQLQKNDLVYLFSDGFADQFGGDKGKKFKYKQLKDILLENQNLSMIEQRSILENKFTNWKGKLEQVDDVLVIGIKV